MSSHERRHQTILLVEGQGGGERQAERCLRAEGYRVELVAGVPEALESVQRLRPSLILLSQTTTVADVSAICGSLRRLGDAAIIVMGPGEGADKVAALEFGADDYITLPFNSRELAARVRAVLRRYASSAARHRASRVGDLVVDHDRREVRVGERLVELRRQEFDLLAAFVANPGVVLERDRLLQLAWGYDHYGDSRTVDVHVNWLRQKLRRSRVRIETVWGIGYKLVAEPPRPTEEPEPADKATRSVAAAEMGCRAE